MISQKTVEKLLLKSTVQPERVIVLNYYVFLSKLFEKNTFSHK